jgi:hypothetical protein
LDEDGCPYGYKYGGVLVFPICVSIVFAIRGEYKNGRNIFFS